MVPGTGVYQITDVINDHYKINWIGSLHVATKCCTLSFCCNSLKRQYTQHNDTSLNDIQHNNKSITSLSITTLSINAPETEFCYTECHLCWLYFMVSVTNKPFILIVIMLNVVMLSDVAPSPTDKQCWLKLCWTGVCLF